MPAFSSSSSSSALTSKAIRYVTSATAQEAEKGPIGKNLSRQLSFRGQTEKQRKGVRLACLRPAHKLAVSWRTVRKMAKYDWLPPREDNFNVHCDNLGLVTADFVRLSRPCLAYNVIRGACVCDVPLRNLMPTSNNQPHFSAVFGLQLDKEPLNTFG